MDSKTTNRAWKWFAVLVILLGAIFVVAKVRSLRHDAKVTGCWARLHEVAFTVSKYNQKHGHLPPRVVYKDGVAMHSWRVLILEDWQPQLFAQYRLSEPWNSPHNSLLANQMPDRYRCPLERSSLPTNQTTYVAVADSRAVLRTNTDGTLRQEDVPPDSIMLIEFSSKPGIGCRRKMHLQKKSSPTSSRCRQTRRATCAILLPMCALALFVNWIRKHYRPDCDVK